MLPDRGGGSEQRNQDREFEMTEADVIQITSDALWTAVVVAGPLLLIALVVGLVIGFLQALTQIQEMTLVFVPKMAALFVGGILLLPFMIATLSDYMERLATMIVGID